MLPTLSTAAFGDTIFYREAPGPADKVLWVHGYTMDSSLWQPLWSALPGWHHIGIDLPYHGGSPDGEKPQSMPVFAKEIGELALAYGVKHIVGLSLGALLTLQIATELPDQFNSVTLGSAGINGGPNDPHAGPRYIQLASLYRQLGAGPWMTKLWMSSPPNIFKGAEAHPELWEAIEAVIDKHRWSEFSSFFMAFLTAYSQMENIDRIRQIRMPTLLVVGEQEMPAFIEASNLLQQTIPNCKQEWLREAGHLCLLERPAESASIMAAHLQTYAEVAP